MRFFFFFILLSLLACNQQLEKPLASSQTDNTAILMSYNIRLDAKADEADNWHQRKADMVRYIQQEKPDFLGVQEALVQQVNYLNMELSDYNYIGVGRDDGEKEGEFMAIFFRKDSWTLVKDSTFWLSATPKKCSRGWDAVCHRTATIGLFKNPKGQTLRLVNTHLDHKGVDARKNSIDLLLSYFQSLPDKELFVLMGDFNFSPTDNNYNKLTSVLSDTYQHSKQKNILSTGTFNGFKEGEIFDRRIDYIFTASNDITQLFFEIDTPKTSKGRQLSDHFPIIVQVKL